MSKVIKLEKVAGKRVIGTSDLVYCNTKYHAPYLAIIDNAGEPIWQDKEYIGYGKHRVTYYNVEKLQAGNIIKAAGGSGGNKYPFIGKVVNLTDTELTVDEISEKEISNILAQRKEKPVIENPLAKFSIDQLVAELNLRGINVQESIQA